MKEVIVINRLGQVVKAQSFDFISEQIQYANGLFDGIKLSDKHTKPVKTTKSNGDIEIRMYY